MKYYSLSDIDLTNRNWNSWTPKKTTCCWTATVEGIKFAENGSSLISLKTADGKSYTLVVKK